MWLPLGNSFSRNKTLDAILTGGKYHNMRGMIGNSGNGNSIVSNPWMTALAAAQEVTTADHSTTGLMDFGAACWYFGQRLTDLGTEAGDLTDEELQAALAALRLAVAAREHVAAVDVVGRRVRAPRHVAAEHVHRERAARARRVRVGARAVPNDLEVEDGRPPRHRDAP